MQTGRFFALCSVLAALLVAGNVSAIELRTSGRDSSPFFSLKNGVPSGICADVYAALERIDPELKVRGLEKELSLSLNEKALETGSNDINCGMGKSPKRNEFLRYVELVATTSMVVAVRADDPIKSIHDLDELVKLSKESPVIVRRATVFADRLKELGVAVDDSRADNADNLRKLIAGRGRYYYNIDYLLAEQLREPEFAKKVRLLPTRYETQQMYIVVSKKLDVQVDAKISAAFATLRKSGELETIFKKYGLTPSH